MEFAHHLAGFQTILSEIFHIHEVIDFAVAIGVLDGYSCAVCFFKNILTFERAVQLLACLQIVKADLIEVEAPLEDGDLASNVFTICGNPSISTIMPFSVHLLWAWRIPLLMPCVRP